MQRSRGRYPWLADECNHRVARGERSMAGRTTPMATAAVRGHLDHSEPSEGRTKRSPAESNLLKRGAATRQTAVQTKGTGRARTADKYLFEELRQHIGETRAVQWLLGEQTRPMTGIESRVSTGSAELPPSRLPVYEETVLRRGRGSSHCSDEHSSVASSCRSSRSPERIAGGQSDLAREHEARIQNALSTGGAEAGLIFTDAAHACAAVHADVASGVMPDVKGLSVNAQTPS